MTDSPARQADVAASSAPFGHLADGPLEARTLESTHHLTGAHVAVNPTPAGPSPAQDHGLGMASLGKTALGLAVVLLVIWGLGALFKRMGPGRRLQGQSLRIVASQSVGARERVVVVEVDETWLVLGVTSGSISRLHEMPAKSQDMPGSFTVPGDQTGAARPSFSESFKRALSQRFDRRS